MGEDRLKMPPVRDLGFYQRRRHDKWRVIEAPALEGTVADSHAHLHMLPDPSWELVRCGANGVDVVCSVLDPSEDDAGPMLDLAADAAAGRIDVGGLLHDTGVSVEGALELPKVVLAVGVHPHNARMYSEELAETLRQLAQDPAVKVLGEIGLDYYYDNSPREEQREAFRQQIRLAKELSLPIALHLRDGQDPVADDAHGEALGILQEEGFPAVGTLLHCCALPPEQLQPWVDADCHVAYGGALTFKNADDARAGARIVPIDRLMVETDAPFMTPEPMRGAACTPAHVVFTMQELADVRGASAGEERAVLLHQVHENTCRFLGIA